MENAVERLRNAISPDNASQIMQLTIISPGSALCTAVCAAPVV